MVFEFKHVIHLILIAESFLFSIQLFTYKNISSKSSKILGLLMFCLFLFFISSFAFTEKIISVALYSQYVMMFVFLMLNPLYYLYAKYLTVPDFRFQKKFILHFSPAIILSIVNIIFFSILPLQEKQVFISGETKNWQDISLLLKINSLNYFFSLIVYYVQLVIYIFRMIFLLGRHARNIDNYFSFDKDVSLNWFKIFIVILSINAILEISISFAYYYDYLKILETSYYIVLFLLVNFLGYFGLKQSDIYVGKTHPIVLPHVNSKNGDSFSNKISHEPITFELSDEEQEKIINALENAMNKDKIYYNNSLSIYDVAAHLNTNKTYISYAINNKLGKNFKTYINECRIKEAIRLFSDPAYNKYTLEGISQIVGYTSKSNFNATFKKITGKTPSGYRDKVTNNNSK